MPPKGVGPVGSEVHSELIKTAEEFEIWSRQELSPLFDQILRYWRLYNAKRTDYRKPHEKWRANFAIPYPFTVVETTVSVLGDILNASDPPIQCEGVEQRDEESARAIELQLDYCLRRNNWPRKLDSMLRTGSVQGINVPKLCWVDKAKRVMFAPRQSDVNDWKQRVKEAEMAVGVPAPLDPDEYELWKDAVEAQTEGRMKVPSIPISGEQMVTEYSGPWIPEIPIYSLRYDPLISDIDDHDMIIHRVIRTRRWLDERVKDGTYDAKQVEQGLQGWDGERLEEWERQQAEMLGVEPASITSNPLYKGAVEVWEVWAPRTEHPFQVILNRKAIINHDPTTAPYWHGSYPYIPIRSLPIPGQFHGMSDLHQPEKLFYEADLMRNMRADAILLQVLPVFAKMKEVGMTDLQRALTPGAVLDLVRADGVQQILKANPGIADAFREISDTKGDIDEATGAYPQLRGAPSTIGRVSATEAERRFSQAQVRIKQRAVRVEEDLQRMVKQMLFLNYQFWDSEKRKKIGGGDPLPSIPRESFMDALEMDFRFRGATRSLNADMTVQQLQTYAKDFQPYISAVEMREIMKRVLESARIKGIDQIVTDKTTQTQLMMEQAQQAQVMAPPEPEPPAQVDGELADQMIQQADAEVPPEQQQPAPGGEPPPADEGAAGSPFDQMA